MVLAEFIDAYQALLFRMYQYQVILNAMEENGEKFHWELEEAIENLHEEQHRAGLYDAEDRLAAACESIDDKRMISKIRRQIRLDSTLTDHFDTLR